MHQYHRNSPPVKLTHSRSIDVVVEVGKSHHGQQVPYPGPASRAVVPTLNYSILFTEVTVTAIRVTSRYILDISNFSTKGVRPLYSPWIRRTSRMGRCNCERSVLWLRPRLDCFVQDFGARSRLNERKLRTASN